MVPFPLALFVLAAPVAEPPRFSVSTTDGEPRAGRVLRFSADGGLTLADPAAEIPAESFLGLRRFGRPLPPWPRQPHVILANGDRLPGTVAGGDGSHVRLRPADAAAGDPAWAVPLASVAALWLVPPPADTPADPARYPWRDPARPGDVLLLRNGDTIAGTVESVTADGSAFALAADRGQPARVFAASTVAAVAFDPALARSRRPKGVSYRVTTARGSRVTLSALTSDGTTFTGTTAFGAKLTLPVADVAAVDAVGGKAVELSDLKPKRAVSEGYNGTAWPWVADRTASGQALRLAGPDGGWFDKGLGTHPRTTLTYELGGKYRRFEALVGLDPVTGRRGSAAVRITVDGKPVPLPDGGILTSAAPPATVRADVTGAKELTLVIDFGPAGDVGADVNWAGAKLIE